MVVNHMLAQFINWIKWNGKLIVRTMKQWSRETQEKASECPPIVNNWRDVG